MQADSGPGKTTSSLLSLVFIIFGILVFMSSRKEKTMNKLEQTLKQGKIGDYSELVRYARKLGYEVQEGKNHIKI